MTSDEAAAFERRYRQALGFRKGDKRNALALQRAHVLRQFEIDNYWKRSTYFWALQLVAFAALALVFREKDIRDGLILPIALLGGLTALAGCMTARGSKFWQENWEAHVDMLEQNVEGRLHQTIIADKERSFSVSTVNRKLLDLFCAGWILTFFLGLARISAYNIQISEKCQNIVIIGAALTVAFIASVYLLYDSRSRLPGDESRRPYVSFAKSSSEKKNDRYIIWRNRKD